MCLSKPKAIASPVAQPAPTRDSGAGAEADQRRRLRDQQGTYGNVFTSVLGDPTYNTNVQRPATAVAAIGA